VGGLVVTGEEVKTELVVMISVDFALVLVLTAGDASVVPIGVVVSTGSVMTPGNCPTGRPACRR